MTVRHSNKLHRAVQIPFLPRHEGHVSFLRRPAVGTRFAFCENPGLIALRQSNVAMTVTVNVHEHGSTDEKGVFMDSRVLALGHASQTENPSAQFLIKVWRCHYGNDFSILSFHTQQKMSKLTSGRPLLIGANRSSFAQGTVH